MHKWNYFCGKFGSQSLYFTYIARLANVFYVPPVVILLAKTELLPFET